MHSNMPWSYTQLQFPPVSHKSAMMLSQVTRFYPPLQFPPASHQSATLRSIKTPPSAPLPLVVAVSYQQLAMIHSNMTRLYPPLQFLPVSHQSTNMRSMETPHSSLFTFLVMPQLLVPMHLHRWLAEQRHTLRMWQLVLRQVPGMG